MSNETEFKRNPEINELRVKLDQMTERITSRLKDRTRFPTNNAVYQPDGVPLINRPGISFFQFAIEGLETYHASLGRFDYSDQYPVLGPTLPSSGVERVDKTSPLPKLDINISDELIHFYKDLVSKHCKPGDDPNSYGETVYLDADLIHLINERINIGRYVAEAKVKNDPSICEDRNKNHLITKLKDKTRETSLIEKVRNTAQKYELSPNMAEEAFRWIIDETINVEVSYIQKSRAT